MERRFALPQYVAFAMSILERHGYKAYAVGGCTRDFLMNIEPQDYDICTSARPEETAAVFAGFRTIETGIKHGTLTVVIDGNRLEITTFRTESGYSDMRHPDEVGFTDDYCEDAKRRDFTMNAIAYSLSGEFIDYFDGIGDIAGQIIRAIGSADTRFCEDALRILRALRFAAVTGFEIEPETDAALRKNAPKLRGISAERIYSELTKLLCGNKAGEVIDRYFDVMTVILPELAPMRGFAQHNPHHIYDVLGHTLKALDSAPQDVVLRFTMLFHDSGKPDTFKLDGQGIGHFYGHAAKSADIAMIALKRLRAPNEVTDRVVKLIRAHDAPIENDERFISRRLSKLGTRDFFALLEVMRADCAALAPEYLERLKDYDDIETTAHRLLEQKHCFSVSELAINGDDLLALGIERGPEIGRILNRLLETVIEKKAENDAETLTAVVKSEINRQNSSEK